MRSGSTLQERHPNIAHVYEIDESFVVPAQAGTHAHRLFFPRPELVAKGLWGRGQRERQSRAILTLRQAQDDFSLDVNEPFHISTAKDTLLKKRACSASVTYTTTGPSTSNCPPSTSSGGRRPHAGYWLMYQPPFGDRVWPVTKFFLIVAKGFP